MSQKKLLTMQEACRYLGISRMTLLKTECEGLITPMRTVGGHRRYAPETLDLYLRATTGLGAPVVRARQNVDGQVLLPRLVERLARNANSAENIMKEVLQDLIQLLQADAGLIALLDGHDQLLPRMSFGLAHSGVMQFAPIPLVSTVSGRVLALQHPFVYDGSESDIPLESLTQGVCAPLVYQGAPLGVIHILSFSRHQFLPTEVEFLSLIALYLASILVNAQVLAESKRREDEMTALNRLGLAIQEQRDQNDMAEVLLNEALAFTKADGAMVLLIGPDDQPYIAASQGIFDDSKTRLFDQAGQLLSQVLDSQEPYLLFPSLGHSPSTLSNSADDLSLVALFPLNSHEEGLGVLLLAAYSPMEASHWQTGFLALACAQAALAVQREVLCQYLARTTENERLLRRYYEKMVEMAPVGIEIIDQNYKIIGWNQAVKEMTGIPCEEALGADKFSLQPGLLKQNGAEIVAKVFETALIQRIPEFAYERRDGTVQYMDLTFLPYSNDDGVVTAIIVFAQKATENKIPRQ